jgi:hypothetical protein
MSEPPPEEIHNVSTTQLSIARHYGAIHFRGTHYTYVREKDMLIRSDIQRARMAEATKYRRIQRQIAEEQTDQQQGRLF